VTAVAFGALAAVLWGIQNVLLASSARQGSPEAVAARYVGYQLLMVLPLAAVTLANRETDVGQICIVFFGGISQGLGVLCFTRSLALGSVGVMTGLVSLEGAGVALLSVGTGESLGLSVGLGILLASAGGCTLVAGRMENAPFGAVRLALLGALFNAVGLWSLGFSHLGLPASLLLFSAGSVIAITSFQRARDQPIRLLQAADNEQVLVCSAALGLAGLFAFATGARGDSIAIAAVLAAQFASVAALGGLIFFDERLSRRQLAGFVTLIAGVSIIAATS
jgi:drug/metabolite transporter (DMT)-like permease